MDIKRNLPGGPPLGGGEPGPPGVIGPGLGCPAGNVPGGGPMHNHKLALNANHFD